MIVHFVAPARGRSPEIDVEYDFGSFRVPIRGELIEADGTDSLLPRGLYEAGKPVWQVTMRGPEEVQIPLTKLS